MNKNVVIQALVLASMVAATGCVKTQNEQSNVKYSSGAVTESFFSGKMQVSMPTKKNNIGGFGSPEIFKTEYNGINFVAIKKELNQGIFTFNSGQNDATDAAMRLPIYLATVRDALKKSVNVESQKEEKVGENFCVEMTFKDNEGSAKICLVDHFAYGMVADGPNQESYVNSLKIL